MRLVDREGLQKYLCDVSRSTVWRYMRQGMPFIQAVKGSPYMYDLDAVDAWLVRDQTQPCRSASAMCQHDTPEQKELICQIIDMCGAETIYLDWDGIEVSKDEAKKYVREYGQPKA